MMQYTYMRRLATPLALSLALAVGACKKADNAADSTALKGDSSLSRDLEMANKDTAAQPQLQDVPNTPAAAPAPATPTRSRTGTSSPSRTNTAPSRTASNPPASTAPTKTASGNTVTTGTKGSEGALARIPAGTTITLNSSSRVCTNTHKPGDRFTATVAETVTGENGATIPAGATAVVQVSSVNRSDNATDPIKMGFVVQSININGKNFPVDATITDVKVDQVRSTSKKSDATKVVGGAVIGAIAGQILGKDTKSTVIGAATGAAAGTAVAMATGNYEGCVPQGGRIAIRLNSPATVTTTN